MPSHSGTGSDDCSAIVFGSRKSSFFKPSDTTIACLPSGVKYRLYGSSTGTGSPWDPSTGLIGISELPWLFSSHNVRRSYDGTMCCGSRPALNDPTTFFVVGSIIV